MEHAEAGKTADVDTAEDGSGRTPKECKQTHDDTLKPSSNPVGLFCGPLNLNLFVCQAPLIGL